MWGIAPQKAPKAGLCMESVITTPGGIHSSSVLIQFRSFCYRKITTVNTVYLMKYAHSFVVLCFVVVMQSFIMNSHEVFIHIHQGCFAGTGAIVRLPQCQWSKPDGYGKISQCITTTKHSTAKTVCIFLGIYCTPEKHIKYYPHKGDEQRTKREYVSL